MATQRVIRWRKTILSLLVVLGLAAFAFAHEGYAEKRRPYGGEIVTSLLSEPVSGDPVRATSLAEVAIVTLVFDTLFQRGSDGEIQPHLAMALPVVSQDKREAVIALPHRVPFHSGRFVSPRDVVLSLRRAKRSHPWLLASVRSVRSRDQQIVLRLRRPTPELAELLSVPATSITLRGRPPKGWKLNGTGPFQLKSYDRVGRKIRLRAATHFGGRPYVESLVLRWYENFRAEARQYEAGHTHLSSRGQRAFVGHQPKYPTATANGPATLLVYVGFGNVNPIVYVSKEFRRALSLAIGRTGLRNAGIGAQIMPTLFPAPRQIGGAASARKDLRQQNEAARTLLRSAMKKQPLLKVSLMGSQDSRLEVIIDATRPEDREVAENVVAALFRLGLSGRITALSAPIFAQRVATGACDLYIGQLVNRFTSPALATAAAFAAGRDSWPERILRRNRLSARRARKMFLQRVPLLPLFHRSFRIHYRKSIGGTGFSDTALPTLPDLFFLKATGQPSDSALEAM